MTRNLLALVLVPFLVWAPLGCLPEDGKSPVWDQLVPAPAPAPDDGSAVSDEPVDEPAADPPTNDPTVPEANEPLPVDCNGNGVADALDVADGTSPDCDANGVPDECQPDSDADGAIDACDGCPDDALKTAPEACGCGEADTDLDNNGVPDCLDPDAPADNTAHCAVTRFDTDAAAADLARCFVAEGRIGNAAPRKDRVYELDLKAEAACRSKSLMAAGYARRADFRWQNGVAHHFALSWDGALATFTVDNAVLQQAVSCERLNALQLRSRAQWGSCTLADLSVNGEPLDQALSSAGTEPGPTTTISMTPGKLRILRLTCDLQAGFTLTGTVRFDWNPYRPPKNSQLAFEIAAGYVAHVEPPADCNGNGLADADDIESGASADCDSNGVPDECQPDSDGDGAIDPCDGCPAHADQTAPGACGCGVPETDSDADGTPDCVDGCPEDPDKTQPGACGCGNADADTDADGTPDCADGCPDDANKVAPGLCGCGVADTDTDADGTPDCFEQPDLDPDCHVEYFKNDHAASVGFDACYVADGQIGRAVQSHHHSTHELSLSPPRGGAHCRRHFSWLCGVEHPFSLVWSGTDAVFTVDGVELRDTFACDGPINAVQFRVRAVLGEVRIANLQLNGQPIDAQIEAFSWPPKHNLRIARLVCDFPEQFTLTGTVRFRWHWPFRPFGSHLTFQLAAGRVEDGPEPDDCNSNGIPDAQDIAGGTSADCDSNGVPDECQDDSDADGVIDACDGCPDDPNKTASGTCGCGVADADTDGDGQPDCTDACPDDPDKTAPGVCGCGVPDTDTDADGTPDCVDLCPADPAKTEPGTCGCGVADTDTDADGTPDCIDGCPDDPAKTAPGACGCGVADTDADGDGAPDCNDACPDDPNKTEAGACGCGVADTDSDADGTPDCVDGCPNDPSKTDPGVCGCGVADADTDGDGVPNCNDGCPDDPNKTAPGACGCGVADADTDGDGQPDCTDACPDDPNKTQPGACGCGVADTDTDADGTPDCLDNCPNDPSKTEPGLCGCGVADTDTDGDGTPDCNDQCPDDPAKTEPGACGCGVADTDTDADGTPDCNDGCPDDPAKTAPGACGCGVADADTDGDGTPDCNDQCPDDPDKTEPGACGCGVADTDSDGDGVPDCNDQCPDDPDKTEPGACGCGNADTDSDGDGTPDCLDLCPDDPAKTEPGVCGCDVPDIDTDSDDTPDCLDNCPDDPDKTEPGACGCGVADTDTDADGVPDCLDLCPDTPPGAVVDPSGCDNMTVDAGPDIVLDDIIPLTLHATVVGGAPPYAYVWTAPDWDGSTDPEPQVMPAGTTTYTVVVTDSSVPPKSGTDDLTVTINPPTGLQYTILNLDATTSRTSYPYGLNDAGDVVGYYYTPTWERRAFLYRGGVMQTLPTLGGPDGCAQDINNAGQVVGEALDAGGQLRAFIWDAAAGIRDLGTLGGPSSVGYALNELGHVVGYSEYASSYHAFLYADGTMSGLGTGAYLMSGAFDINNSDQIVGVLVDSGGLATAFLFENGTLYDLGAPLLSQSQAWVINDAGLVAGTAWGPGEDRSFLCADGQVVDLGALADFPRTYAAGINDAGQVVGTATNATGSLSHAFIFTGGELLDLNTLLVPGHGWDYLAEAYCINSQGQIAGYGVIGGQWRGFVLTPVP